MSDDVSMQPLPIAPAPATPIRPPGESGLVPHWLRVSAAWAWRLAVLVIAGLAVFSLLAQLLVVSLPVIIALILSTLCVPLADRLRARGIPDAAAASIVVLGGLLVIVGVFVLIAPSFASQVGDLGQSLQDGYDDVLSWLQTGPLGIDRAQLTDMTDSIRDMFSSGEGGGSAIFSGVLAGAVAVVEVFTALALTVILLFFFVKDGKDIVDWFLARTPDHSEETVRAVGRRAWGALAGYVRGTATIAMIDAVGITIGLLVLGVPLAGPLFILILLGGFLPVIGAFAAGLVAVLVALAAVGPVKAVILLGVILGVQQMEGHILQPMIMKRAVSLHPIVILVSLAAGAALFGIVGAFLSVPIAAVVAAAGNELRLRQEGTTTAEEDAAGIASRA